MSHTHNYDETVASKWEDIRRDGPGVYTSILEHSDNSIDWGMADTIEYSYDKLRGILTGKDNGPNGFGSIESLHRFFTLGEKNMGVKETTIGKFGKGGYKACINMSNHVKVVSYFDNKGHCIETDFIAMENKNNSKPTTEYHEINCADEVGSLFTLHLRPNYQNTFNDDYLTRQIIRAYHDCGKDISFKVNGKEIIPSNHCPYINNTNKESYTVYYDYDTTLFTSELLYDQLEEDTISDEDMDDASNKNRVEVGIIELYILKDLLKKNDLLGDFPGIDIYRNNRLCNTKNPLTGIGNIGSILAMGGMRGSRCHMVFRYKNVKISETLEMDNQVGLSTWKEIEDDAKEFDGSLLSILQEKATRCNKLYEDVIKKQMSKHMEQLEGDHTIIDNLLKLSSTELAKDKTNLKLMHTTYYNLLSFKTSYFDNDELVFKYCISKGEATKMKREKKADVIRSNSEIYKSSENLYDKLKTLMKHKKTSEKNEQIIKKVQKEMKLDRDNAVIHIHNENGINEVKKKVSEADKCDNLEEAKGILLDAKKITINDEGLLVELDKKLLEVTKKGDEQKLEEEEAEKQQLLEEEEADKQRLLEEEEADKQRLLEEEEAEKQRLLEKEGSEKQRLLNEEAAEKKYKDTLKNIHEQDNEVIHDIIQDWIKKNEGNYKSSIDIVKLIAESLL